MVTIYVDGQPLARARDGVGSYTEYLLSGMIKNSPKDYQFRAILFSDQRSIPKLIGEGDKFRYVYLPFPRRLYALLYRLLPFPLPVNIWLPEDPSAIWYPNFVCFPFVYGARRVLTVHDFTYIHYPQMVAGRNLSYLRKGVPTSVSQADRLTTVSKHIAGELQSILNPKVPIEVINPPISLSNSPTKPKTILPKQYLLFVGTIEPRKNIPGLLDAYFKLSASTREQHKLIVAGKKGWISRTDFAKLESAVNTGYVVWLDGPSDDEIAYLYAHARLLLSMSHYEGFGIPLKEASSLGLPIVAIDSPAARESAGHSALYGKDLSEIVRLVEKELDRKHPKTSSNKPIKDRTEQDSKRLLKLIYN